MGSRASLLRYYAWQVDDRRKVLADLFAMAEAFDAEEKRLDMMSAVEQVKAAEDEIGRISYPGFVRQVMVRRDTLQQSRIELEARIDEAKAALELAYQDLKKIEVLEDRRKAEEAKAEARREQAELDELGLRRHGSSDKSLIS